MPDHCFCEALGGGLISQPANTWSSLGFVVVAALVLWKSRTGFERGTAPVNAMTRSMAYPTVFATALLVIGAGSAFYHASMTFAGQFADVMGMYLLATFILLYGLGRQRAARTPVLVASYVMLNAVLAVLLLEAPGLRRYVFAVLIAFALLLEANIRRRVRVEVESRYLMGAVGVLVVAFAIWAADLRRLMCFPDSLVQGHAAWHLLGAGASWLLYRYYMSERASVA